MKRGKNYRNAVKGHDRNIAHTPVDAVSAVKKMAFAKFDETVEISMNLNMKKGNTVRDTLVLAHQFKAEKKILVFAKGAKAEEARVAGAAFVGDDDLIAKIREGWLDFDVAVATPDMMKDVGKLGQILGRRGLMPNPKTQTVTMDVTGAIAELRKGRTEFRSDKSGCIHLAVGKVSMDKEKLVENIEMVMKEVARKRPVDTKGDFVKSVFIASTMGPGVKISRDAE
jgi:large subunit ribosomal protein L1